MLKLNSMLKRNPARSARALKSSSDALLHRNALGALTPASVTRPSLRRDERGQGLAEYIIIVILVAIIVLVAVRLFGRSVFNQFSNATTQVDDLENEPPVN